MQGSAAYDKAGQLLDANGLLSSIIFLLSIVNQNNNLNKTTTSTAVNTFLNFYFTF